MTADEAAVQIADRALLYAFLFDVSSNDVAKAVEDLTENCRHEFTPAEQLEMDQIVVKAVKIIRGPA